MQNLNKSTEKAQYVYQHTEENMNINIQILKNTFIFIYNIDTDIILFYIC